MQPPLKRNPNQLMRFLFGNKERSTGFKHLITQNMGLTGLRAVCSIKGIQLPKESRQRALPNFQELLNYPRNNNFILRGRNFKNYNSPSASLPDYLISLLQRSPGLLSRTIFRTYHAKISFSNFPG